MHPSDGPQPPRPSIAPPGFTGPTTDTVGVPAPEHPSPAFSPAPGGVGSGQPPVFMHASHASPASGAVFVNPALVHPQAATGPLLDDREIRSTLRRRSQRRVGALLAWTVLVFLMMVAKDSPLMIVAVGLWAVSTVALPVWVIRANRAENEALHVATAIGSGGRTISAYEAGRLSSGHQSLCAVAAFTTFGTVGRGLGFLSGMRPLEQGGSAVQLLIIMAVAGAAAVTVYRTTYAALQARATA